MPRALKLTLIDADEIYEYQPANNGAGPLWCYGSTVIIRTDEHVFATGIETLPDAEPLNNCRWTLYRRNGDGWDLLHRDEKDRTREPSPMVTFQNGEFFVSTNPTRAPLDEYAGPSEPQVLRFSIVAPDASPRVITPEWEGTPKFTEHSYRTFAADGRAEQWLLMQNQGMDRAFWTMRDREGQFPAKGQLLWPTTDQGGKTQPLRLCYPAVQLQGSAAHFLGVGDIVEPIDAWKKAKHQITGVEWDYVFRRLFYTWSSNLVTNPFKTWIEIANYDETAGQIYASDVWVAPSGEVHVLWQESNVDLRIRDEFFPKVQHVARVMHATLRDGELLHKRAVIEKKEGEAGLTPKWARFHVGKEGRLFVFAALEATDGDTTKLVNAGYELLDNGDVVGPAILDKAETFGPVFVTATHRAGNAPSNKIDVVTTRSGKRHSVWYGQLQFA